MSTRLWIGAAVATAIIIIAGVYRVLQPDRYTSTPPVKHAPAAGRPSPLTKTPELVAMAPGEHATPPPAPAPPPPAEQTPQSLAAMIQALQKQSPDSMLRVTNVKHDGGRGCHGMLVFTAADFRFECPGEARESFRIARSEVGKLHKNGVQVWKPGKGRKLGRRYHFSMVGRSNDLVEGAFAEWMKL